jgi:ABC-type enterochelin transport system ATPase subunit
VTHAVDCVDLSYRFGAHTAVDHVNLSIEHGEMVGLLGPNGAERIPFAVFGSRPRVDLLGQPAAERHLPGGRS